MDHGLLSALVRAGKVETAFRCSPSTVAVRCASGHGDGPVQRVFFFCSAVRSVIQKRIVKGLWPSGSAKLTLSYNSVMSDSPGKSPSLWLYIFRVSWIYSSMFTAALRKFRFQFEVFSVKSSVIINFLVGCGY